MCMNDFIELLGNDNVKTILGFIISVFTAYFTAKLTLKSKKKSLTTQYFKEKGVEKQEQLLNYWCELFSNEYDIVKAYNKAFNDNEKDTSKIINYINRLCFVYCSSSTIKAVGNYCHYAYRKTSKDKKNSDKGKKRKNSFYKPVSLILLIIVKMKYDFTGEKIDAIDLLRSRVLDLNLKKQFIFKIVYRWNCIIKFF